MMATTAAALAPAVIPMMSGLASGLRTSVWKIAPESPNATPTHTAVTVRGRRRSHTTKVAPSMSAPPTTRRTSTKDTMNAPTHSVRTTSPTVTATRAVVTTR